MRRDVIYWSACLLEAVLLAACAALPVPPTPQPASTPVILQAAPLPTPLPCIVAPGAAASPANRFDAPAPPLPAYVSGDFQGSIDVFGLMRTYLVHVPQAINCNADGMPLLIALHGEGSSGNDMMQLSRLNALADTSGFAVVYPNGSGSPPSWNAGACCGAAAAGKVDDVAFVRRLIDMLLGAYPLNARKVYIIGYANGGLLAYRLGVELAPRLAGLATIGAVWDESFKLPATPVSLFALSGDADPQISSAQAMRAVEAWATADGCALPPQRFDDQKHVELIYEPCRGNAAVFALTLKSAGRGWPASVPIRHKDVTTDMPTASALWDFLVTQSK